MKTSELTPLKITIAARFVTLLRAMLTPQQFSEMQNLNATADAGICHSHDYCDANMVMAAAFAQIVGRESNLESDNFLWSAAWAYAMTHGLGQDAAIEAAAADADVVRVGQVVRIKKEWQDLGDENYVFTAITEPNATGHFKVRVTLGLFPSVMELHTSHIHTQDTK